MSQFPGASQYQVRWWGFPNVGSPRRIKPTILLVVHITSNSALPNALGEAINSNRDGSDASFSFVTNRDGSIVQCLDPQTQTPWTNGLVNQPSPTVGALIASGYNANEYCFATCENVGYEPGNPITDAQVATMGRLVKWLSGISGLPINRSTVLGHRDFNNVIRHDCPTSGDLEALLARIIAAAGAPAPTPTAPSGGDVSQGHPATYIPKSGRVQLTTNRAYNAFQYLGLNADGTPNLKRFTNLRYTASTNAVVIARAHWEVNKAEADCFLVTPWAYLPGTGWVEMLWWSKSPLPEPDYTDTAGTDCTAAVAAATAPLQAKLDAARKALA